MKDVGCKDKGDTHSGGGIGDNTTEFKRKSEDHNWFLGSARILRKVLEM